MGGIIRGGCSEEATFNQTPETCGPLGKYREKTVCQIQSNLCKGPEVGDELAKFQETEREPDSWSRARRVGRERPQISRGSEGSSVFILSDSFGLWTNPLFPFSSPPPSSMLHPRLGTQGAWQPQTRG